MEMGTFLDLMRGHKQKHQEQLELQDRRHQEKMRALTALLEKSSAGNVSQPQESIPLLGQTSTLLIPRRSFGCDYLSRFSTFLKTHDVPESRKPQLKVLPQSE